MRKNLWVWVILLVGIVLRYYFIFDWHPADDFIFSDMEGYVRRAEAISEQQFYPAVFFQPVGYSLLMSWFLSSGEGSLQGMYWIQFVLSSLTPLLVWLLSNRVLGRKIALAALIVSTFHFPFIYLSGLYLAETIFTFLVMAILVILSLRERFSSRLLWGLAAGAVFGLAYWFKGNFVFFPFLFALWSFAEFRRGDKNLGAFFRSPQAQSLYGFALACSLFLVAHGYYSQEKIGKFQLSASAGGLNFVEGKCRWKINRTDDGYWWHSPLFVQLGERDEKHWDVPFTESGYYTMQALECIADRPWVLVESLRYIPYLFINNELWPRAKKEWGPVGTFYNSLFPFLVLPGFALGMLLLARRRETLAALCLLMPMLSIMITVWIFKSEIRFRIPFDGVTIPIALLGWREILLWLKQPLSSSVQQELK